MQRRSHSSHDDPENPNNTTSAGRSSTSNRYRKKKPFDWFDTLRQIYVFGILSIVFSLYFVLRILPGRDDSTAELQNQKETIEEYSVIINDLKISLEESNTKYSTIKSELERVKNELHASQQKEKDLVNAENELKRLKEESGSVKENKDKKLTSILKKQVDKYTKEIQAISRREVEDKFGPGPHKVEITIEFPPEAPFSEAIGTFIIELAPIDLMPHAVYLFLQQVSHGLWDGMSFHRNAGHVLQAGVSHYFNTPKDVKQGAFQKLHLKSLSFQEYSDEYPHVQYTVGFAGRPGGPDWYVSIVDNSEAHGPGGQDEYELKGEADSCFGKVVDGIDTIKLMHKMPKEPGDYEAMKYNVGIKSARIIEDKEL